ncbi:hypothetical protein [Dyella sp.]|jgi:hypothetical protein|uniref:hypothetical protein n=1 Tax=Dyella sp. TaxID=1869338 RepID=UPI002FD987F7
MDAAKFVAGYERAVLALQARVAVLEEIVVMLIRSHPNGAELENWWEVTERKIEAAIDAHQRNETFEYFARSKTERFSELVATAKSSYEAKQRRS